MNFYSDQIINDIIDTEPLENIIDSIESFTAHYKYTIVKYSINNISHKYTTFLLKDSKTIIAFHCMDNEFSIANCPSILIYRKYKKDDEIRYYILLACTKRNFRGQGYASRLIDGLVERVKSENDKPVKIILSSLENAVLFYEEYGFRWKRESILEHPLLIRYEGYDKKRYYYIMELVVIP